jgi:hypothetical protein
VKVKIIKSFRILNPKNINFSPGETYSVRQLQIHNQLFNQTKTVFQIIDGDQTGENIPFEYCIVVEEEKIFTQKEVQAIEQVHLAKLEKLSAEKDRAIDLVTNMSKQMVKKNAEIEKLEFYVSALSIGLSASSEAIQVLRGKEKV